MGRPRTPSTVATKCPSCGAPLHRELVGHTAALMVTADLTPLTPEEQATIRGPNRLIWCYRQPKWGTPRLIWTGRWHPSDCPHQHVADHACNGPPPAAPPQPATLF
ncbi:hypothetical protein [Streptomyces sp. NBC_01508]|uniref:hypothetical protein n=1 Tax=Streptomyces sp. NBC_01508 TaxID=2903888 RepID=UPI00386F642C